MADPRKFVIIAALAALAGTSWWVTRMVGKTESAGAPPPRHEPDYIVEDFTARGYDEQGRPRYRLSARRLLHYPDDDSSHLEEPYLVKFPQDGAAVHTRARKAELSGDGARIDMIGSVHIARGRDPKSVGGEIKVERMRIELDK